MTDLSSDSVSTGSPFYRVVTVEALADHRLWAEFVDGTTGEVHLDGFLADPKVAGTVFEPLRESAFFARAAVIMGTVQWPNGAYLAPRRCTTPFESEAFGCLNSGQKIPGIVQDH